MRPRSIAWMCACVAAVATAHGEDNSFLGFGSRLKSVGDIDGDGVVDFVIGSRRVNPDVRAISGKTGAVLWNQWGYDAVSVPDRNKDGCRDVLVARSENAVGPNVKDLWGWFCDGKTGKRIGDYPAIAVANSKFGTPNEMAELGDVDGDGSEDLLLTHFAWPGSDEWCGGADLVVRSVDGPLGASIGEKEPFLKELSVDTRFRHFVAGAIGDLDGDGRTDLAVSCPMDRGAAPFEFRTAKNAVIVRFKSAAWVDRPEAIVPFPDADGDGRTDLLVGRILVQEGTKAFAGEVRILSGKDGKTIRDVRGAKSGDNLGASLAVIGDVDGDGIADFAAGAPGADRGKDRGSGAVHAFSGKTGKALWVAKGSRDRFALGTSLCALGDMDGDGSADLAAGSEELGPIKGYVLVLSGKTGKEIRRFEE